MKVRSYFLHAAIPTVSCQSRLTSCSSKELNYTAQDGSLWRICTGSDYQAPSVQIINSIKSRNDCAQLCQQYNNGSCTKAVYDKTNWVCHLKGQDATWIVDAYYDSIRYISKPVEGSTITACPGATYNVTTADDARWSVCKLTDYDGTTVRATKQVTSETACAELCSTSYNCSRAVYDASNLVCYEKDGFESTWTFNSTYESITLVSRPVEGAALSSCPSNQENVTAETGRGWAICNNTDFVGAAVSIINQVTSAEHCILQCDQTINCTRAVWDVKGQICSLKNDSALWTYASSLQGLYLVNGTQTLVDNRGNWAPIVNLPLVPAAAFIVPEQPISNRILAFSSWGPYEFSGATGMTQFVDYNWQTGKVSSRTVTETKHDMFCPGMSFLTNGTMVVTGGENAEAVSLYNYATNTWTRAADMKIARGYQSSATLSNGKVFTIGGSFSGGLGGEDAPFKSGELFDADTNTWTLLSGCDVKPMLTTDAEGPFRTDNHAWLFGWKNGYVFQAGPSKAMHWYDTANNGRVIDAGIRDTNDSMCGVNVLYDALKGQILAAGGSQSYTNSPASNRAHLITIDTPGQAAIVERLPDMNFERGFANVVVLPNGQSLITGGQLTSLVFTDVQSVLAPELYNPTTKTFSVLRPATIPRNYHSVSLLLADGSVWSAGGGLCPVRQGQSTSFCDQTVQHFNGEIFTPPYLFNADGSPATRPVINNLGSNIDDSGFRTKVGGTLTVDMGDDIDTTFALVRIGSATHSINTDQRRVPLTTVARSKARYIIKLPNDAGILLPGYYYFFAMNEAGVPCIARTIQVVLD